MNQRWQGGLSPFDGDCLISDDRITVEELRELLTVIVPELEKGCAGQALYAFDDWHQHDGYITGRRAIDWLELAAVARSADVLIASRQGDTYVHRSFYPEDLSFLLRYDVSDEERGDGSAFSGAFDLSAKPEWITRTSLLAPPRLQPRLRVEASKTYFDRTYAG